jgi:hypothetical protein
MFTQNSRNQYDKKDSLELGQNAESRFAGLAIKHGWTISPASGRDNINEHYDYLMRKDGRAFKVEVKSLKRVNRRDVRTQDQYVWIELRNVRGESGWLYGSADLIAFEMTQAFRIVGRTELVDLVEKLVDFKARVGSSKEALYKLYSRKGRPDLLTIIKSEDLLNITYKEWKKEE